MEESKIDFKKMKNLWKGVFQKEGECLSLSDLEQAFKEIEKSDEPKLEKRVQRYIVAVKDLVENKYGGCWEKTPWVVQFAPVLVKFFRKYKYAKTINPGLDGFSGFMGTSKQEIVERLNPDFRPDHVFFEEVPTMETLEKRFEEENNQALTFPIICKPDIGERATGVVYMHSREQLEKYLETAKPNFHLEKFHDEKEFALSWTRDPDTGEYKIWSLVEKKIPSVKGDGRASFRELIVHKIEVMELADDRKEKILACFPSDELNEILPNGEEKTIVKTASISYGTTFKKIDITKSQTQAFQQLLPFLIINSEGLYQGRFDFRTESLEALLDKKLKIIELNGLGGMPMEIYESHLSLEKKYEILFTYFEHLIRIGEKNVHHGNATKSIGSVPLIMHAKKLLFSKDKTQNMISDENEKESLKSDVIHILKLVLGRGKIRNTSETLVDKDR